MSWYHFTNLIIWNNISENISIRPQGSILKPKALFLVHMGFFLINLNSLHPRMLLCQFWLKLTQWFFKRRFFVNVFSQFRIYFPLEKGGALNLYELEFISPKDDL